MRAFCILVTAIFVASAAFFVVPACDNNPTRADAAHDAMLQVTVAGAQFYRGPLPADQGGPKIVTASISGRQPAGNVDQAAAGNAEISTTAIAVGIDGDSGYWILSAKPPSSTEADHPVFTFGFSITSSTPAGTYNVDFRAVDGNGRFGPPAIRPLVVTTRIVATGTLVVSLSWDNAADLDLHVVLPSGIEIFKRNRTEYVKPVGGSVLVDPNGPFDGGVLDRDSNAQCVQDGQRDEDVVWQEPPPKGHYIARVDTYSLCGAASSPWKLVVLLEGTQIAAAQGVGTTEDVQFDHGRGGGVLAVEFDVP